MRKLAFLPAAAMLFSLSFGETAGAVDLGLEPLYTKPSSAPAWNWSGFYVSGHGGGGWANTAWFEDITKGGGVGPVGFQNTAQAASGLFSGGHAGINYQAGQWVFGVDVSGASCLPEVAGPAQTCPTKFDSLGTVTGRFGAAFDRSLIYVNGGFGWVSESYLKTVGGLAAGPASETRGGWTLGAGVEYSFTGPWYGTLQYDYIGVGTRNVTNTPGVGDIRDNTQVLKLGINYRFGWGGPVVPNR